MAPGYPTQVSTARMGVFTDLLTIRGNAVKNRILPIVLVASLGVSILVLAALFTRYLALPVTVTVSPSLTSVAGAPTVRPWPPTWTPTGVMILSTSPPTVDVQAVLATADALELLTPIATPTELPAVLTAWAEQGTVLPTSIPVPPTSTPTKTPEPTPTMTREEQALLVEMQHRTSQSASSVDQCSEILKTQPWCSVPWYVKYITRLEWERLFPTVRFLLLKYNLYGGESVQHRTILFAEQGGQRYLLPDGFRTLMDSNHAPVTDENRETVARAFVLTTLADYVEEEIVFSNWEQGSWPAEWTDPYNYKITVWTKIQGLQIEWVLRFDEQGLQTARGGVEEYSVGDYIDVSFASLPLSSLELRYWRR
jgi:hypothetical protein